MRQRAKLVRKVWEPVSWTSDVPNEVADHLEVVEAWVEFIDEPRKSYGETQGQWVVAELERLPDA